MRVYPNEKLHTIAKENYGILSHYCSLLEAEGYWQHPSSVLGRTVYEFLAIYMQAMMIQLAVYMKAEDAETLRMIAEIDESNPLDIRAAAGLTRRNMEEAKRLGMAPPILLQLCGLRDVEKHSSMTGLFFDAILNILFSMAYLNQRQDAAVTRYIKEYYGRIHVFIENANSHGACVDEKYIFHKICMGELEENTELLKEVGEDFASYKKEALFLEERAPKRELAEEKDTGALSGGQSAKNVIQDGAEKSGHAGRSPEMGQALGAEEKRTEPENNGRPYEDEGEAPEEKEISDGCPSAGRSEEGFTDDVLTEGEKDGILPEDSSRTGEDAAEIRTKGYNQEIQPDGQNGDGPEESIPAAGEELLREDIPEAGIPEELDKPLKSIHELRLDKLMKDLEALVGLSGVKEEIHSLINLIRVRKMREAYDLPGMPMSYHMVFTGNPGTGKTTVARLVGEIYKELGILSRGTMTETDRAGLVAGYVGQTALKVKEVVDKAKGGVLFIDEAYTLSNSQNGNDFGTEAIDMLVKLMEDYRNDLVVIVAGYTKEMETFLKSNTGLISRFNKFIEFPDYSDKELIEILYGMAEKAGFQIEEETRTAVENYLVTMKKAAKKRFGNARGIRNLFEKMVAAQANRVVGYENPTKEQLSAITLQDCSFLE